LKGELMLERGKLLNMLKLMYKIRRFEERAKKLYKEKWLEGSFLGALHSYAGEEAIAVGACSCLKKSDYILSTHRGHGHCLAKGGDLKKMLAELQGKETGYSRGRGGSMHLFAPEIGLLGGNGIVGGGIPISLGVAYSAKYRNSKQVTVCFFGDGAATQGTFHESLNIASLWKLPVVFICENNLYAVTTPVSETISVPDIGERARAYGIPGKVIDGQDVLKVHQVVSEAVDRARAGEGPTLIECKTYRYEPHCAVIAETRAKEEIEEWKRKDPISRFEKKLLEEKKTSSEEIERIKSEVLKEIDEAEDFAKNSPFPDAKNFKESLNMGRHRTVGA
jgi:pyruvate dehydrogenase E1 component alpha subunit